MPANRIVGIPAKVVDEFIDRAGGEGHGRATAGAHQMMAVTRSADNIGGVSTRLEDPGDDIDRCQDLECSIDRCPPQRTIRRPNNRDQLLGGERPVVLKNRLDHGESGRGRTIAMTSERLNDLRYRRVLLLAET